ncbi:GspH/FimT family pseudopilin [Pseudoalteromonas sp. SR43-6]|jgi:type IV fimbrial biogenesis protein FimT|uniref:GspH/FimT family pseudopilin n=1 Tax=Pseudoalteromonas TaxID=53246 RepID=UPI0015FBD1CF|nr:MULTISPECIES: GspH/FimT family pseudopilin [Pseudoalteromonas]MBB1289604.1 GspH/FimT family pseudopilin [Pseudoalteromonas sp. SR41-5]MBB1375057.1 GspH/FimT family pseudopilin [Pseudoalteromonas sp. SR43-6]MBB1377353.1 GspH/FimT family pseudopilin [Pseudoalteromonas sp. SR43-2]MBB1413932.1 GspH/FimT family pseudopilin [Pseudoalteromonas sp. SG43-8]MBD0410090.1 GspH/FimT family pseudopilin [Pseudoalteromonas distincta]|tara:strand:+ start:11097 stop:11627 length:531 start_codon:yes stop_codon:yes gene_type:complete
MRLSISKNKGVTLLELMVSMAVVSIISQLSMWFYPDFLAKNRLDNHVNLLHRNINYGRLYAIENGTYVTLCALKGSQCTKDEWDGQMSLFIDKDKSTTLDDDELLLSTFEDVHDADTLEYPRNAITFRPDGSLNGFQNGTFIYCPNSNKANLEGLALSVSQTGRIRIKSTDKCQKK